MIFIKALVPVCCRLLFIAVYRRGLIVDSAAIQVEYNYAVDMLEAEVADTDDACFHARDHIARSITEPPTKAHNHAVFCPVLLSVALETVNTEEIMRSEDAGGMQEDSVSTSNALPTVSDDSFHCNLQPKVFNNQTQVDSFRNMSRISSKNDLDHTATDILEHSGHSCKPADSCVSVSRKKNRMRRLSNKPLCHICGRLMLTQRQFEDHLNMHADVYPFTCAECGRNYRRKKSLTAHIWNRHINRPYKCCECSRDFKTPSQLLTHLRRHYESPPCGQCSICGIVLKSRESLRCHEKFVHRPADVRRHLPCGICGKKLGREKSMQRHLEAHDRRPYKCFGCSAEYELASKLRLHVQLHFLSLASELSSSVRPVWRRAVQQDHKSSSQSHQFSCPACDIIFRRQADLRAHVRLHPSAVPVFCDQCNRPFKTNSQLKSHVAHIHSDCRHFPCQFCRSSFKIARELRRHVKKRHNCAFTSWMAGPHISTPGDQPKQSLGGESGHGSSTEGNATSETRPQQDKLDCNLNLRATYKQEINGTSSRKFACEHCSMSFRTKTARNDHTAAVHAKTRSHACYLCERTFAVARELTRHLKTKHNVLKPTFLKPRNVTAEASPQCKRDVKQNCKPQFCSLKVCGVGQQPIVETGVGKPTSCEHGRSSSAKKRPDRLAVVGALTRHRKTKHSVHKQRNVTTDVSPKNCQQAIVEGAEVRRPAGKRNSNRRSLGDTDDPDWDVSQELRGPPKRKRKSWFAGRQFACDECGKVFQTKVGLGDHVAAVHGAVRRQCLFCERSFAVARELTRHMKTKHSNYAA